MAQQIVNNITGSNPDTLKVSFDKLNANDEELYAKKLDKSTVGNTRRLQHLGFGTRIPIDVMGGGKTNTTNGSKTGHYMYTGQSIHTVAGRGGAVFGLKPLNYNFTMQAGGTVRGANDIEIKAGIFVSADEDLILASPFSFNTMVSWGGKLEDVLQIGGGQTAFADDGQGIIFEPNQEFAVRTTIEVAPNTPVNTRTLPYCMDKFTNISFTRGVLHGDPAAGTLETTKRLDVSSLGGGFVHNTNGIVNTAMQNATSVNCGTYFVPALIVGYSEKPQVSVRILGDSNAYGLQDSSGNAAGDGRGAWGFLERGFRIAAGGVVACANWSRVGANLEHYERGNSPELFWAADYHTHLLQQISGNSVGDAMTPSYQKSTTTASVALPFVPTSNASVLNVTVNGSVLAPANYSIAGATITFSPSVASNALIIVNIDASDAGYVAQALANMKRLTVNAYRKAKAYNLITIQTASLPRTNAGNTAPANGWQVGGLRDQFNAWLASIAGQKINKLGALDANGRVYLDIYWNINATIETAANLWLNPAHTFEGIHFTPLGAQVSGAQIAILADLLTVEL